MNPGVASRNPKKPFSRWVGRFPIARDVLGAVPSTRAAPETRRSTGKRGRTEEGVVIGANAVLLGPIRVGRGAEIGAVAEGAGI
ncbi:hypothetical protein J7K76_04990 [Candidatus Bipolaricaulota bacterium]|nr:hypothetical protein [Candidatus Bipolaricaulota bacterium]